MGLGCGPGKRIDYHINIRCDLEAKKERTPKVYAHLPLPVKAMLLANDVERTYVE